MDIFQEVKENNLVELKKYLQYGNIDVCDKDEKNLLHYAVLGSAIDCATVLVENDIDINKKDVLSQTPLFDAAIKGKVGLVKLLVRNNCDVNIKDNQGNIALFYAIKSNNVPIVDLLLDQTDVSLVDDKQEDALFKAIEYNYSNIEKFYDIDIRCNYIKDTILHKAVKYNNLKVIKQFCNRILVNQKNSNNETVFFYAAKYANREIVIYLLKFLPILDFKNKFSEDIRDACMNNPFDIKDLVENYYHSLNFKDYKLNNKIIYDYLCTNEISDFISKVDQNKKDNFELSLIDYMRRYHDKVNIRKLEKQ